MFFFRKISEYDLLCDSIGVRQGRLSDGPSVRICSLISAARHVHYTLGLIQLEIGDTETEGEVINR